MSITVINNYGDANKVVVEHRLRRDGAELTNSPLLHTQPSSSSSFTKRGTMNH